MSSSNLPNPKRIKDDARKLRKANPNLSQSDALKSIALRYGFPNFNAYNNAYKRQQSAVKDPEPSNHTTNIRRELVARGLEFTFFIPTETAMKKSIIDATEIVRSLFVDQGFHDYTQQGQGEDYKILKQVRFIHPDEITTHKISLYRPKTKDGDPRMWIYGLKKLVPANSVVAIFFVDKVPHLINLTGPESYKSGCIPFLDAFASTRSGVADRLLAELNAIAEKGPIESRHSGDTAIGMAIEHALGIPANSSRQPDYHGIELKSTRKRSKTRNTLFAQVADWRVSKLKSSKDILEKYGYERDDAFKLYCTVSTQRFNSQGLKFEFSDDFEVLREIHHDHGEVACWPISLLKRRLLEKHAETFWIKADSHIESGKEWFILQSITHTKAPLSSQLIPLLQEGAITMDHLIKRNSKGRVSEKGPLFKITDEAMDLLFPSPSSYKL